MIEATFRPVKSQMPALRRAFDRQLQQAALRLTDRAATKVKDRIRAEMTAAGLGRLGFALGAGSDLKKSGSVRSIGSGWSASGWVFIRSGSQRTRGAIEAYTQGASITPKNPSGLLWFPTEDIMRMVRLPIPSSGGNASANYRLTPKLWDRTYASRFGPLVRLKLHGKDVLVVRNATLSLAGKPRSLRPLTKRGKVPKGQVAREFVVAFIGIPSTTRAARVNPLAIARQVTNELSRSLGINLNVGA